MIIYPAFALNRGIVCFNIVLGEGGAGGCGFSLWVFIYLTPVYGLSQTRTVPDAPTLAKGEHDECMLPHLFCQHGSHYLESRNNGCEAVGREATPRHNQNSFCASDLTKGTVQSACNMRGPCVPHGLSEHLEALSLCRTELIAIQCTHLVQTGQALQVIDCTGSTSSKEMWGRGERLPQRLPTSSKENVDFPCIPACTHCLK